MKQLLMSSPTYEYYVECPTCGVEHRMVIDFDYTPGDKGDRFTPPSSADVETDLPRAEFKETWKLHLLQKLSQKFNRWAHSDILEHPLTKNLFHQFWVLHRKCEVAISRQPLETNYELPCGHFGMIDGAKMEEAIADEVDDGSYDEPYPERED